MSVPCPCCKANNEAGPNCRRCKADLALLFAVADQQARALAEAKRFIAEGRFAESLAAIDRAERMRRTPEAVRLRAVALLLARDFAGARCAHGERSPPGG